MFLEFTFSKMSLSQRMYPKLKHRRIIDTSQFPERTSFVFFCFVFFLFCQRWALEKENNLFSYCLPYPLSSFSTLFPWFSIFFFSYLLLPRGNLQTNSMRRSLGSTLTFLVLHPTTLTRSQLYLKAMNLLS